MSRFAHSFVFFVDADTLLCGGRNPHGCRENARRDFQALKERALDGRAFDVSFFHVYASLPSGTPEGFVSMLTRQGFRTTMAMPSHAPQTSTRAMAVRIAVDAVTYRIDGLLPSVVSIASGDADLIPVYTSLQSMGVRVEVVAFPEWITREVSASVDRVILLASRVGFQEITEGQKVVYL